MTLFESLHPHMVEFAREDVVHERVETSVLDMEVELCLMEWGVEFSVRAEADPGRCRDLIKGAVDD